MNRIAIDIPAARTVPTLAAVLEGQGIPPGSEPGERTARLGAEAIRRYAALARPAGVLKEIEHREFDAIYHDQVADVVESPVGPISRRGDTLALFAVTLGEPVCEEIARLFATNDFAGGALLDSAASAAAELAADALEGAYRRRLKESGRLPRGAVTLRFSPGYCGWHLGAQRALFAALRPDDIGIALNDSCLMRPLKSVSGVVIAGPKEIFEFEDHFSFCAACLTHECRHRIESLGRQED